jgi:SOS-response transcriptional repressor LexA
MTPRTPPGQTREKIYRFVRQRLLEGLPPTVREVQEHFGFRAVQTVQEHLKNLVAEGRLVKLKGKARGYSLPPRSLPSKPSTVFVPLLGRVQAGGLNTAVEDCEGYIPVLTKSSGTNLRAGETPAASRGTAGDSAHAAGPERGDDSSQATGTGPFTTYHNIGPADPSPAGGDAHLYHLRAAQPTGSGQLFALRVQGESMTGAGILPGDIAIVRSQPTANNGDIVVALVDDEATVKTLRFREGRIELHPENPDYEPIIPAPDECVILGKVIETRRYVEPLIF